LKYHLSLFSFLVKTYFWSQIVWREYIYLGDLVRGWNQWKQTIITLERI
jgi:hypothetical protein